VLVELGLIGVLREAIEILKEITEQAVGVGGALFGATQEIVDQGLGVYLLLNV
jgi:hypothetical protein